VIVSGTLMIASSSDGTILDDGARFRPTTSPSWQAAASVRVLGLRKSIYQRAPLYSVAIGLI
jgi:hypothetical protein